jgi:uncharacterized protein involved in exopolysaccharide biosynthesis
MPGETFGSILGAIYRRRLTVVLVTAGAIGAGVFYMRQVGPDFMVDATVMVPGDPPTVSLSSESQNVPTGPYLPDLSDDLRLGAMGIFGSGAVHDRMLLKHPELDPRALRRNLRGNIDGQGNVEVIAYAPDAERAAAWVNDFADCFQDEMQAVAEASMRSTLETFRAEEPVALARLREIHQSLVGYLGSVGSVDLDADLARLFEERRVLEDQLLGLELARARGDAERPVIERTLAGRPEFVLNRVTYRRNPAYEQAVARTREISTQIALARLQFREQHPELLRLQTELEVVRRDAVELLEQQMVLDARTEAPDELTLRLTARLADLDIAAAGFDTQREVLERRRTELDGQLVVMPAYQSEVALRDAEIASVRAHWERLAQRRAELEFHLRNGLRFTIMTPAMRAKPEDAREVPAPAALFIFCTVTGLCGGLLLAIGAELLARLRAARPF